MPSPCPSLRRAVASSFAVSVLAIGLLVVAPALAGEEGAVEIGEWLLLGPVTLPLPAFHDEEHYEVEPADLLELDTLDLDELWPAAGFRVAWPGREPLAWSRIAAPGDGVALEAPAAGRPAVAYLAAYVETGRFRELELEVISGHLLRLFVGGEQVGDKTEADGVDEEDGEGDAAAEEGEEPEAGSAEAELALPAGKHLLLVQALLHPDSPLPWAVRARLSPKDEVGGNPVRVSTSPRHRLRIAELLDVEAVSQLELSPDGRHLAVRLRRPEVPSEDQVQWLEIRRAEDGAPVFTVRGGEAVSAFTWGPRPGRFSYVTQREEKATLWLGELATGEVRPLLEGVERLGAHRWAPDGRTILYSLGHEEDDKENDGDPEKKAGLKRLRSLEDRWAGWRTKGYLYEVSVEDGSRRRLTGGSLTTELQDVRPDGRAVLLSRPVYEYDERPFSYGDLYELDLRSLEVERLARVVWFGGARYSPDGRRILVLGGASAFDGAGLNLPEGAIPNEYDTQGYILDPATGAVEPFTREFDPALGQAEWSPHDGRIYLTAQVGSRVQVYAYQPDRRRFERLDTGLDVVSQLTVARQASRLAVVGSSPDVPPRIQRLDLPPRRAAGQVLFPGEERFARVDFGRHEAWSFVSEAGDEIVGRVHYPPGFDPQERYPVIVYYYGGTSPVSQSFGGRYPFELWNAHGYVVYVLQPSGATGFGQAFSARHVNNWGRTVAGEIIEGTEKFLAAHPFADPERVGCIGASYGGFMTMLLVSETDLFAGCVAHAGISSLSSYWGEGWWGYLYSAVASAGSYPWNRPDIYVDQSPLFRADRISTPLLLLHGDSDTNVPPGESDQLFTALKLLGRDVEYVSVDGEDHWILDYPKRVEWKQTILAWFDKQLKGEPEWWDHLYPR